MRRSHAWTCLALIALFCPTALAAAPSAVNESARQIPVAYDVDVLVVGGSTGAVEAAVAAAGEGAKVFLAAPNPYLGDDMTATLRLWLEEGEEPSTELCRKLFSDPLISAGGPSPNRIACTYEPDIASADYHKDSKSSPKLTDGLWGAASKDSVQYDGDVNLVVDLGKAHSVDRARVVCYQRTNGEDRSRNFKVASITFFTSDDGESWEKAAEEVNRARPDQTGDFGTVILSAPLKTKARYVKLAVKKAEDVDRILLGEIEILAPADDQPAPPPTYRAPRPMHVKKTLDEALLEADVTFLYSCYPTDVLTDGQGSVCGIVMANRAGRQAVVAKRIIDATDRATVARLAGAEFRPYPAGTQAFQRVIIGGRVREGEGVRARVIPTRFQGRTPNRVEGSGGLYDAIEYTLELPMADASYASWAKADQIARTKTYDPDQQFTSDVLFQVPPDPVEADPDLAPAGHRPKGLEPVFILGGCADVARDQAAALLRPAALMELGRKIGSEAAREASAAARPSGVKLAGEPVEKPAAAGDVKEFLSGVRPIQDLPTIPQDARAVPVLGEYDVVVVGGGTAGAPAGIAAARQGAKTLVVELHYGLGGVGTVGAISKYYWGNRVGFTATVPEGGSWLIERRMEWWRSEILKAGGEIWFGTMGCGAFVEGDEVQGVVVATPEGRGVVLAKTVIDATGNSDVAAAAGAKCYYTDDSELAMQGTGLPGRTLGTSYTNTDFTIADETDVVDIWHLYVFAKNKYEKAFDQGRLVDTRERRRIVGEATITLLDQVNGRTYPDSVVVAYSNFDTHGYTVDPYLELDHPEKGGFRIYIPYRAMLPKGLQGILVVGLGISAHRDAVPMIRMQPDIQNGGYAAGVACAMATRAGVPLRYIDLRKLQEHLVEIDNLPETVLEDKDSYPFPAEEIAKAVESVKDDFKGVSILLAQPDDALPLVRKAYESAQTAEDKLTYARILAVLGDGAGAETLIEAVRKHEEWDKGWDYRGMGQFGSALSPLDQLIVALGRTGEKQAVPAILEKAEKLDASSEFSHHRAVALALEMIGDRSAAKPLADILTQPDIAGYVHDTVEEAIRRDQESPGGTNAVQTRRNSLRELSLARALFRCGDYGGIGRQILTRYTNDLRGHFARHAKAVLDEAAKKEKPETR